MKTLNLPSGYSLPALGLGTWRMGEREQQRQAEVAALKRGLDLGMRLIDTAEMYGEGGAETVIAEAIAGQRESVFLVSKLYPQNASRQGVIAACERSLQRLKTDLYRFLRRWLLFKLSSRQARFATMGSAILTSTICRKLNGCLVEQRLPLIKCFTI